MASVAILALGLPAFAQDASTDTDAATAETAATTENTTDAAAADSATDAEVDTSLTEAELDELVAPVALYPDTLLIQILVASTYPIDVVKADRFVKDNADLEQEALNTAVDAEGWDESVAVLAQGFPDVLANMADHIDWTQLIGDAMLVQSDDVMEAVQRMREQADSFGNLESGEEQTVTRDENEQIVITPTDPEVVYVPTYTTSTVYYRPDPLITFTSLVVVGAIWSNSWGNSYWGCRNCAGWGGGGIYNRPNNNININGDVNIGNRNNNVWKPDNSKQVRAKTNIGDRKVKNKNVGSNNRTGVKADKSFANKPGGRGDDLRRDLSNKTGTRDISRPNANGNRDLSNTGNRPNAGNANRANNGNRATNNRARDVSPAKANKGGANKAKAAKPKTSRQPTAKPQKKTSSSAFNSKGGGNKARKSTNRGSASRSRSGGGAKRGGGGGRRR
ncbi:MAG: DUF3300 domain-containing protein [Marinosulfonomonas sp.]